jgi:hypothetical protein
MTKAKRNTGTTGRSISFFVKTGGENSMKCLNELKFRCGAVENLAEEEEDEAWWGKLSVLMCWTMRKLRGVG